MKRRQETVAEGNWDGSFEAMARGRDLGRNPRMECSTFFDAQGRRCITQQDFARARDEGAFPVRYRWETSEPRKHR